MAGTLAGIAAIFYTHTHRELLVWLLISYCASFSFSLGAVIWVYMSEVFPNGVRSKGQSLGSITHWIVNAINRLHFLQSPLIPQLLLLYFLLP